MGCPDFTRSPEFTLMAMTSPLVSALNSTPWAARMVPTASSSLGQIADCDVAAPMVIGGGVKSVPASVENLLYK
jgi:hypothetical protein